jgi:2-(1,2-epoxy-1,2-dihydrophenyl)acetyl-CoA isomerase
MEMSDEEVLVERHGVVARVVLNRPEKRNPLGLGFSAAMHRALDEVEADPGIAAVVLTGNGPVFCGGGDVSEIMSPEPTDLVREFDLVRSYNRVISRIYHFEQPIIAAVNGPAVGGGACLAMACDIAIAAEGARYDFAFGRIGLAGADMGATHLLQRLVGPVRAAHLVFTGGSIVAAQGREWGVFVDVVALAELMPAADRIAASIATQNRPATAITKLAMRRGYDLDFDAALEYEAYLQSFAFRTEGHKKRLAAFRNRGARK